MHDNLVTATFPRQSRDRGWPTSGPARATFPIYEQEPMTRGEVALAWIAAIAVAGLVALLIHLSRR